MSLEGFKDAVHVGLEARPVIRELRLVPDSVRFACELRPRRCLLGGDGDGLVLLAGENAELGGGLFIQLVGVCSCLELRDEVLGRGVCQSLVVLAGECAHGLGARGGTLGRSLGLAIEFQDAHEVGAKPEVALKLFELGDGCVFCHGGSSRLRCGARRVAAMRYHTVLHKPERMEALT